MADRSPPNSVRKAAETLGARGRARLQPTIGPTKCASTSPDGAPGRPRRRSRYRNCREAERASAANVAGPSYATAGCAIAGPATDPLLGRHQLTGPRHILPGSGEALLFAHLARPRAAVAHVLNGPLNLHPSEPHSISSRDATSLGASGPVMHVLGAARIMRVCRLRP